MTKKQIASALQIWANSAPNDMKSEKLAEAGVDDFGDLNDESPAFREWMDKFWTLVNKIEDEADKRADKRKDT